MARNGVSPIFWEADEDHFQDLRQTCGASVQKMLDVHRSCETWIIAVIIAVTRCNQVRNGTNPSLYDTILWFTHLLSGIHVQVVWQWFWFLPGLCSTSDQNRGDQNCFQPLDFSIMISDNLYPLITL